MAPSPSYTVSDCRREGTCRTCCCFWWWRIRKHFSLIATTLASLMQTLMPYWSATSTCPRFRSGTQAIELCLHRQTAAVRSTTSGSASKVSRTVHVQVVGRRSTWHYLQWTCRRQPWQTMMHALPQQIMEQTVKWFNQVIGHLGEKRLHEKLQQRYHHPKLRYTIDKFKCQYCQQHKLSGKGYGLLPEWEMQIVPWEEVGIGLIGPRTVKVNNRKVEFNTLMYIDMVSNLVQLIQIDSKTSGHIRYKFVQCFLPHYPCPAFVYTTRVVNSLEACFNGSSTVSTSRMFSHLVRTCSRTQFMNICTKQWATCFKHCCIATCHKIWHMLETLLTRCWQLKCMTCK